MKKYKLLPFLAALGIFLQPRPSQGAAIFEGKVEGRGDLRANLSTHAPAAQLALSKIWTFCQNPLTTEFNFHEEAVPALVYLEAALNLPEAALATDPVVAIFKDQARAIAKSQQAKEHAPILAFFGDSRLERFIPEDARKPISTAVQALKAEELKHAQRMIADGVAAWNHGAAASFLADAGTIGASAPLDHWKNVYVPPAEAFPGMMPSPPTPLLSNQTQPSGYRLEHERLEGGTLMQTYHTGLESDPRIVFKTSTGDNKDTIERTILSPEGKKLHTVTWEADLSRSLGDSARSAAVMEAKFNRDRIIPKGYKRKGNYYSPRSFDKTALAVTYQKSNKDPLLVVTLEADGSTEAALHEKTAERTYKRIGAARRDPGGKISHEGQFPIDSATLQEREIADFKTRNHLATDAALALIPEGYRLRGESLAHEGTSLQAETTLAQTFRSSKRGAPLIALRTTVKAHVRNRAAVEKTVHSSAGAVYQRVTTSLLWNIGGIVTSKVDNFQTSRSILLKTKFRRDRDGYRMNKSGAITYVYVSDTDEKLRVSVAPDGSMKIVTYRLGPPDFEIIGKTILDSSGNIIHQEGSKDFQIIDTPIEN